MTRDELKEILESDKETGAKVTEILNKYHAKVDELTNEVNEQKLRADNTEEQLTETNKTLKEIKKENADNRELQSKLEELEATNSNLEQQLQENKIASAVELSILKSGVRNSKFASMIQKSLNMDDIKFGDDGVLTGLDEQLKALKEDEDTASLFELEIKQEEAPKQQAYYPVKGDEVKQVKSQGARLAEELKAQRQRSISFEQLLNKGD